MRADEFLFYGKYFDSRTKAKQAIENGEVFIDGKPILKPSESVSDNLIFNPSVCRVGIKSKERFVSLGGYKLAKALKDFGLNVKGLVAVDVGASTGGFTDCLLQNGAKKVYSVDLNDDLLHDSLKKDKRVVPIIKNAKDLKAEDVIKADILTADLSFISATQVLPVFYEILPENGVMILLIKPQFETGAKHRFKNGIIKDKNVQKAACLSVYQAAVKLGFTVMGLTCAPIVKDKNTEFLLYSVKGGSQGLSFEDLYVF